MKTDLSYGVIPLRRSDERWLFLTIQHQAGHWDFPKGHPEGAESEKETASRELKEETGLEIAKWLDLPPAMNRYQGIKDGEPVDKTVLYFAAIVKGELHLSAREAQNALWGSYEAVRARLTYDNSRLVIDHVWNDLKL